MWERRWRVPSLAQTHMTGVLLSEVWDFVEKSSTLLFLHSRYKASKLRTRRQPGFTLPSAHLPMKHSSSKGCPETFDWEWGWLYLLSKCHTQAARNSPQKWKGVSLLLASDSDFSVVGEKAVGVPLNVQWNSALTRHMLIFQGLGSNPSSSNGQLLLMQLNGCSNFSVFSVGETE